MKQYRTIITEHLNKDAFGEGLVIWYEVKIQMRVLGIFWIDVRKPIESDNYDYALSCAEELIEYLEKEN